MGLGRERKENLRQTWVPPQVAGSAAQRVCQSSYRYRVGRLKTANNAGAIKLAFVALSGVQGVTEGAGCYVGGLQAWCLQSLKVEAHSTCRRFRTCSDNPL